MNKTIFIVLIVITFVHLPCLFAEEIILQEEPAEEMLEEESLAESLTPSNLELDDQVILSPDEMSQEEKEQLEKIRELNKLIAPTQIPPLPSAANEPYLIPKKTNLLKPRSNIITNSSSYSKPKPRPPISSKGK